MSLVEVIFRVVIYGSLCQVLNGKSELRPADNHEPWSNLAGGHEQKYRSKCKAVVFITQQNFETSIVKCKMQNRQVNFKEFRHHSHPYFCVLNSHGAI